MLMDASQSTVELPSGTRLAKRRRAAVSSGLWVPVAMFVAVALVATAAFWDEERESRAALEDFAQEQSMLAAAVAAGLNHHPGNEVRDALSIASAFSSLSSLERPGSVRLLILPSGETMFHTTDARLLPSDVLRAALDEGRSSVRLTRPQAALLGLPPRTALAGLARVDAGNAGRWGIAVVASAVRERDRETRAGLRLALGVLIAAGLVIGFGSVALRRQHGELVLERELAVAELARERDDRLLRANRAATMGTLAIGLAHELSTPLGIIVGRAEQLLPKVSGDERAQRSLTIVLDQAARIEKVIRGFLDLARGGVPTLKRVSPVDIARGATSLVEHRYAQSDVALTVDPDDDLPTVNCDLGLMEHALVNLLLNSCDACRAGGAVNVAVRVERGSLLFRVDDDGQGITADDAARATEPFFTTKAVGRGTGLGLAIANEIVKSHRGSLSIGPRSPRGTRACLFLPLEAEAAGS
jgi:two-component system NtrC family sensor kinase